MMQVSNVSNLQAQKYVSCLFQHKKKSELHFKCFWSYEMRETKVFWWPLKRPGWVGLLFLKTNLGSFTTDTSCQLDVLGHDSNSLSVNGTQVSVFKQADQVTFASFLEGHDSGALESEISLEVLSNLSHESLERQLSDQQLSRLLVSSDFSQGNGSWSVSVRFLHTTSWGRALSCCLGCQLLSGSFTTGWFSCSLLRSCHLDRLVIVVLYCDEKSKKIISANYTGQFWITGHHLSNNI